MARSITQTEPPSTPSNRRWWAIFLIILGSFGWFLLRAIPGGALDVLKVIALFLEGTGIFLLFREVWYAHRFESTVVQLDFATDVMSLIESKRYRDAYLMDLLFQGKQLHEAQRTADEMHEMHPEFLEAWGELEISRSAPSTRQRQWKVQAFNLVMKKRHDLLYAGVLLVLLSLLLQLLLPTDSGVAGPRGPDGPPGPPGPSFGQLFRVENEIRFSSNASKLAYRENDKPFDLTPDVCAAKRVLHEKRSSVAIIIGRHDQRELGKQSREQYVTNAGLATQRAQAVAKYLAQSNECGPGIKTILRLGGSSLNVGKAAWSERSLADDRIVEIYGIEESSGRGAAVTMPERQR